jgi:hypothetical protein
MADGPEGPPARYIATLLFQLDTSVLLVGRVSGAISLMHLCFRLADRLPATSYSLERLFRWASVSRSLMSAGDNFGRSSLMLSFTIFPVKVNGTW